MNATHICHLTSLHPATDTRIFQKECQSLSKAGYQVSLIVANQEDQELNGVSIKNVQVDFSNRVSRMQKASKAVFEKAKELDAVLYHFHDPELIPIGLKLKKLGKKVIYDSHENVPLQILTKPYLKKPFNQIVSTIYRYYEHYAAKKFDAIVVANPTTLDRFKKTNPNTIDVCNFPRFYESAYPNWEDKPNELFYVGTFTRNRGIYEMVKSIEDLEVKLNLGGIWHSQPFKNEVMALPGWKKTKDLGYLDRQGVIDAFSRSKIGFSILHPIPSYKLNYSVKVFEYMAASIPVITSDFPIFKNIVEKSNCGICVPPLDTDAIKNAIQYLLENPEEAKKMGENGLQAAKAKYNWESEEKKLIDLYKSILG